ncbi:MAG: GMP synthase [Saprospiraceae bacterium]|nr:GMP synthase [Saprospiraceae bacterium]
MNSPKIAVLDLYKGKENEEVKSIKNMVKDYIRDASVDIFEVRESFSFPDISYHAYIVSGGPGDPNDSEGLFSEMFGQWLDGIRAYNSSHTTKKQVLLICHSFQMACLHWKLGKATQRQSPSFGVYPVHLTNKGVNDPITQHFEHSFYVADFRHFQIVEPDEAQFESMNAKILALEKVRPNVPLERAIMAVRFTPEIMGVQFHPEVSPARMRTLLKDPVRREKVIQEGGLDKYQKMLKYLNDTSKMHAVHNRFIHLFLDMVSIHAPVA